jgi:ABC-type multidrug transport system fused ATPase/permease subunit
VAALTLRVRDVEAGLDGVLGGLRAIGQLVPLALVLVLVSPRLAGAALFVLVPFALALGSARRRWKRAHLRAAEDGDALLEAAEEAIRHGDLWATYGASAKIATHVARLGHSLTAHTARLHASAAGMSGANEVLGALALVCALGAARAGWLGAGELPLVAFAVPFFLAYRPLRELTEARLALARATAAYEALPVAPAARDAGEASDDAGDDVAAGAIEESRAWALEDLTLENVGLVHGHGDTFDLTLRAGEIVALAGPTGSGKTTLLRTLLGLEALRAGDVRYGTSSLRGAGIGPSSRPFAWVPQDAPLLADTLDANVMLAAKNTTTKAMLEAIGAARLVADVGDAKLAGGPARVSGGERQWIVLARAIATRLPVLLLDEPTSGLDEESQRRVLDAIVRLRGERTVLIVTHRPEPLALADRVIRLGPAVDAPREVSGLIATG